MSMNDEVLAEHMKEDAAFQNEMREWKETIATKQDIQELKDFMKNVNIGVGIFKFSWNNAGKIGAFGVFLFGIYLLFKVGFVGALIWISKYVKL